MDDIILHHFLSFFIHNKRIHHPTPVAIQKGALWQGFQQFPADSGFSHAHGAIDDN